MWDAAAPRSNRDMHDTAIVKPGTARWNSEPDHVRLAEVHSGRILQAVAEASTALHAGDVRAAAESLGEIAGHAGRLREWATAAQYSDEHRRLASLSARERQVVALLADGRSLPHIAEELDVSASTVKTHVRSAFAKLGVRSGTQAAVLAVRHGMV